MDDSDVVGVLLLRRIAYTLLALYRAVTLRSDEGRATRWRALLQSVRDATGTGRPWPPHGPASDLAGPPEIPERWRNLAIGLADHACPKRLMAR